LPMNKSEKDEEIRSSFVEFDFDERRLSDFVSKKI